MAAHDYGHPMQEGGPAGSRGVEDRNRPRDPGRFTVVGQWVLAVLLPAFVYVGRALVGAELGWMAVIGIAVYGLPTILLLMLPPVVTLFDRTTRPARTVRRPYAIATWVQWGALVVAGLTIPDAGDSGHLRSALSRWTGLSYEVSETVFYVAFGVLVVAWVTALAAALAGVAVSRRAPAATP